MIPKDTWKFCWVVDFPCFGWDDEAKAIYPMHHPFTSPKDEDLHLMHLDSDEAPLTEHLLKLRAKAYDVVLNGIELGGGSIRIHRGDVQRKIFQLLGLSDEEAKEKFDFLLDALRFGAPPHGGIALGLDRIVMLMGKFPSIRDVIAFPKNAKAMVGVQQHHHRQGAALLLFRVAATVDAGSLRLAGFDRVCIRTPSIKRKI